MESEKISSHIDPDAKVYHKRFDGSPSEVYSTEGVFDDASSAIDLALRHTFDEADNFSSSNMISQLSITESSGPDNFLECKAFPTENNATSKQPIKLFSSFSGVSNVKTWSYAEKTDESSKKGKISPTMLENQEATSILDIDQQNDDCNQLPSSSLKAESNTTLTCVDVKEDLILDDSKDEDFRPEFYFDVVKHKKKYHSQEDSGDKSVSNSIKHNSFEESYSDESTLNDDLYKHLQIDFSSCSSRLTSYGSSDTFITMNESFLSPSSISNVHNVTEEYNSRFEDEDFVWEGSLWSPNPEKSLIDENVSINKQPRKRRKHRESWITYSDEDDDCEQERDIEGVNKYLESKRDRKHKNYLQQSRRRRPRKLKFIERNNLAFNWETDFVFGCQKCGATLEGFQNSIDHMRREHSHNENANREEKFECILCHRSFYRKDDIKTHIGKHIDGSISFSETGKQIGHLIAAGECKNSASSLTDWRRHRNFTCYICHVAVKGLKKAIFHMKDNHPLENLEIVRDSLSEDEGNPHPSNETHFTAPVSSFTESLNSNDILNYNKFNITETSVDRACQVRETLERILNSVANSGISKTMKCVKDHEGYEENDQLFSFQCILCPRAYKQMEHFQVHVWRHINAMNSSRLHRKRDQSKNWMESTKWDCKKCPELGNHFLGLASYVQHNREKHGITSALICPVCGKGDFAKMYHLKMHLQTHNEAKLSCEICGKLFADGNKMKRHVKEVHQKLKNFMCNACGKCFARKDKLHAHEINVHTENSTKERPYLCHVCGRGFGRQEHVNRHQKICGKRQKEKQRILQDTQNPKKEMRRVGLEVGVQDFQRDESTGMFYCKECNHAFKNKRYIAEHYARNHREENLKLPYRCEQCGKGYKIMRDLIRHQKKPHIHNGSYMEKAFVCEFEGCGRKFGREFELRRHEKIHLGIKDHKCEICGVEFHLRNCLKTHMKNFHNIDLPKISKKKKALSNFYMTQKKEPKRNLSSANPQPSEECEKWVNFEGKESPNKSLSSFVTYPTDHWDEQGVNHIHFKQNSFSVGVSPWMTVDLDQTGEATSTLSRHQSDFKSPDVNENCSKAKHSSKSASSELRSKNNVPITSEIQGNSREEGKHCRAILNSNAPLLKKPLIDQLNRSNNFFETEEKKTGFLRNERYAKKNKKNPGIPMTDEERQKYEEIISEKKLGTMCSVCGKVFRNRDVLDFHIMTTKMPGHEVVQLQKIKSNYAFASMQMEAKLKGLTRTCDELKSEDRNCDSFVFSYHFMANYDETKCSASRRIDLVDDDSSFSLDETTESSVESYEAKTRIGTLKYEAETKKGALKNCSRDIEKEMKAPLQAWFRSGSCEEKGSKLPSTRVLKRERTSFKCMECKKGFRRQSKLIRHVMKHHKDSIKQKSEEQVGQEIHELTRNAKDTSTGRWPCSICGKTMANKQKLQRHIMEVHQKLRQHICRLCHKAFARAEKLKQHEQENHDENELRKIKPIPVPELPVFKKEPLFKNGPHLVLMPLGCLDCKIEFNDKDEILEHMRGAPHFLKDDQSNEIECPILTCNLRFTSVGRLSQHLRIGKHNQPCPSCGKKFKRLDKLEIHLRSHSSDRPFTCNLCNKAYKDRTSLMFHKKTHTGARPYLCPDCGTGFMKPDHMKRHYNSTHLKIKNVKCSYCEKFFADKYKAKIHERKHTGETPYLCSVCARGFKRKEALDQHAMIHKDMPRDFKCLKCSATFKSQQYLNRHVSRHFAEKRWKCPKCTSAFIDKRDLMTHEKHVHQNLRPFICEHCSSAYKTKQGLQIHMKSYPTGECIHMKRFSGRGANRINVEVAATDSAREENEPNVEKFSEGSKCSLKFASKSKLESCLEIHTQLRPFSCKIDGCNKRFDQHQSLKKHMKQLHSLEEHSPRIMKKLANEELTSDSFTSENEHLHICNHNTSVALPCYTTGIPETYQNQNLTDETRSNSLEKAAQKLSQPDLTKLPMDFLSRSDVSAHSRNQLQNAHTSFQSQVKGWQQENAHQVIHFSAGDHSNGLTPFMLHHQKQIFQHQEQQHRQQLLQHQQLHHPLGIHNQCQSSTFPGIMSTAFSPVRGDVDHNLSTNHPTPFEFYQYAANFANINMSVYKN